MGFDDGFKSEKACVVGCVLCGKYVEGFMFSEIEVDGLDATEKIVKMLKRSKFFKQIKCIFLPGITFAGFNVVDIEQVWESTGSPVVVVMRREPRKEEFLSAASKLKDGIERLKIVEKAGEIKKIEDLFVQLAGIDLVEAKEFLKACTFKGKIPEPVRIAHLVASAVIHGESKGKV
ncbi:MAG: DUF99 family protein [Archaeoglobaceae archaeon]|nr:DUF99 family protein [Archaeoglobaceae archaeon]